MSTFTQTSSIDNDSLARRFTDVKYYTKTETINPEIESALKAAPSKSGGTGANIPDIKLPAASTNKFVHLLVYVMPPQANLPASSKYILTQENMLVQQMSLTQLFLNPYPYKDLN